MMLRRLLAALALAFAMSSASAAVRIKDVATLGGLRDNQLVGYGLTL